jgi:hypothetical protein
MKKIILTLVALFTIHCSLFTASATNVSGGIYTNTTWTFANSPYIVTDTVVVFPGVTLTIQPGVVVKFADGMYLEIRQANLIAIGTALDSITFTSNNASPTPGIWGGTAQYVGGIWLNGTTGHTSAYFNYCNVRYATTGITNFEQDTLYLKNSNINYNLYGLDADGLYSYIDTCNFKHNTTSGISQGGISSINFCNISNNGIGLDQVDVKIMNNCIIDSNQTGLSGLGFSNIYNSSFKFNGTGIEDQNGNNIFKNCIIDSNTVVGFIATLMTQNDSIINCEIKYNNGIGINASYPQQTVITKCVIENNITGVEIAGTNISIEIYCNKIDNNSSYDLYYNVAHGSNMSIPNNDWNSTDSATIHSHIYDGYTNINLGLVSVFPIDTQNCYLTGCNLQLSTAATNATCGTCANGSASVSMANGFAPYTFTWNTAPIQTTQAATGLLPGTYTVCVVDAHGCTACHSVTVDSTNCSTFHIATSVVNSSCSTCMDGTATVVATGGTSPYNYTWYTSPFQYTATATNLLEGSYNICVLDAGGCLLCDSVTVGTGSCSAHYNISPDTIPHHYIVTNMASGVPPLTYDWSWGDNSADDYTANPNHTYAAAGFYQICLTIHDSVGCGAMYCDSFYLQRTANTMIYVNVVGNNNNITTGINANALGNHCSIYPNPNDGNFVLEYHLSNCQLSIDNCQLQITDIAGRILNSYSIPNSDGTLNINASSLSKWIYFWEMISPEGIVDKGKMIILK